MVGGFGRPLRRRRLPIMQPRVGDKVGLRSYDGKVSGPYVVRAHVGFDVEIQCLRTGRRMVVLAEDLTAAPLFRS